MKKILALFLSFAVVFSFAGCSSEEHDSEAKTPSGSSIQKGRDYQSVYKEFEESGFTNIQFEVLDDLVTGWMTKDGEVESVSVDGNTGYSSDTWYPADVKVIITYHTFPNKESESSSEPGLSNDTSSGVTQSNTDVLTVENCPELAAILGLKADLDSSYGEFAETYKNRIIEFDGCITYLTNHEDYNTRYDLLISAGDYVDEGTTNPGPTFKFVDVGVYDLGDGLGLYDFVKIGSNVRIQAKVKKYNANTGIFELDPILVNAR